MGYLVQVIHLAGPVKENGTQTCLVCGILLPSKTATGGYFTEGADVYISQIYPGTPVVIAEKEHDPVRCSAIITSG